MKTSVPIAEIDPIDLNTSLYVYPDGRIADETFGVIGAAMQEADLDTALLPQSLPVINTPAFTSVAAANSRHFMDELGQQSAPGFQRGL